ncbi:MAG: hypothetical protein ACI4QI_00155 [Candidatus Coproplasma sp.]
MPKFVCPKCGRFVYTKEERCTECGYEFTYCPECKKVWTGKVNFCPSCGKSTKTEQGVTQSATVTPVSATATLESKIKTPDNVVVPDSQGEVKENAQPQTQVQPQPKPQPQPQVRAAEPEAAAFRPWEECCPNEKSGFKRSYVASMVLSIIGLAFFVTYILSCVILFIDGLSIPSVLLTVLNYIRKSFYIIAIILIVIGSFISIISIFKTRKGCVNWLQSQKIDGAEYVRKQRKIQNANNHGVVDKHFYKAVDEACYLSKNSGMNGLVIPEFIIEIFNCIILYPVLIKLLDYIFYSIYYLIISAGWTSSYLWLSYFLIAIIVFTIPMTILKTVFENKAKSWVKAEMLND